MGDDLITIPKVLQEMLNAANIGAKELADVLSSYMSLPIFITNPYYHHIASSPTEENDEIFPTLSKDQTLYINTIEHIEDKNIDICEITIDDVVYTGWKTTIFHDNKTLGFLFCLNTRSLKTVDEYIPLLQYARSLFIIPLQKVSAIKEEKRKFLEPFLFDVLYGNIKEREEIIEQGKFWEWDFTLSQTSIVIALSDFNHISIDKEIVETMNFIIQDNLRSLGITPVTMLRRDKVIIIFLKSKENKNTLHPVIHKFCENVHKEVATLYPERQFKCGVGKTYSNPTKVYRSFQQAKVALEIGQKLDLSMPFFESLGIERILYNHDVQNLKEFYETTLGPLITNDETSNTELLETLEAFTLNQFDITATAKAIYLHRNTLRYRLNKIEDTLDIKLDDFNTKLKIATAFKIKQLGKI